MSPLDPLSSPPLGLIRAETILSALRERTFSLRLPIRARLFCALMLSSGQGELLMDDQALRLDGPVLVWSPWPEGMLLRLQAGSDGGFALMSEEMLAMAIGHNAESADLWQVSRRRILMPLAEAREVRDECAAALAVMRREVESPAPGSESLIQGHTRAILVHLWRVAAPDSAGHGDRQPRDRRLLQRFRQLLEMHFRARWKVADYAAALNLSTDRLHDICQRNLGKPPRQLVQERQLHEARLMLERSSLTVQQVAGAMGFADSAQFSRFFSSRTGFPPARYRQFVAVSREAASGAAPSSYADWP